MKKSRIFLIAAAMSLAISCEEEGRIDQQDDSAYIPEKVTILETRSIPGGSIIKYSLPDDNNLRGVKVVYERNGELCESASSRYVDSLKVEGFGDIQPHTALIYSIGFNDKLSEPTPVDFIPAEPSVNTARMTLSEVFGGVRIHLTGNEDGSDLAIVLIQDTLMTDEGKMPSDMEWEDVYTFHTNLDDIDLTRRGMTPDTKLFGAYVRDRWNNCSDTVYCKLSPLEEIELPRVGVWKLALLPGDETEWADGTSTYRPEHLFDGKWSANNHAWVSLHGKRGISLTIDMTYVASFSRLQLMPRLNHGNEAGSPWHWQIWGSMTPNPDGSWDDSWYLLGDFTQYKPSGVAPDGSGVGTYTEEDTQWMTTVNEYDFDVTSLVSDPYRPCRYIRFKLLDSRTSYFTIYDEEPTNINFIVGELILHGTQVKTDDTTEQL